MAQLIQCPTCGNKISENAVSCPYCGEPLGKEVERRPLSAIRTLPTAFLINIYIRFCSIFLSF